MRALWSIFLAAALGLIAGRPVVSPAAEGKANPDAIRSAQRQLHNSSAAERVKGALGLRDLPPLDAAKLLVPSRFADPAAEVLQAAYEALLAGKDDNDACVFLLKNLSKEIHAKKIGIRLVAPLIAVLLASDLPDTQRDLGKFLDQYVVPTGDGVLAIATVADELGRQADRQALASLQRMTELKCFAKVFACRRAVIQAMIRVRLPQAVGALSR